MIELNKCKYLSFEDALFEASDEDELNDLKLDELKELLFDCDKEINIVKMEAEKMRYYCPECKSEIITGEWVKLEEGNLCLYCGEGTIKELPLFETPAQYEKRTGKKWNGAVWVRMHVKEPAKIAESNRWIALDINSAVCKEILEDMRYITERLCAASPEPPPDNYAPEVEA